ncbi:MAG: hypothetical protein NDJ90_15980 [Oligoflexia bacterium]|nr:hypothetical protein [Oligoflexia bacterium]
MPRKVTFLQQAVQPIHWVRAFVSGAVSAVLMALLIDVFNMMGVTRFSLEAHIGSLFAISEYPTWIWMIGASANAVFGGAFGIFYGYCFEYLFGASGVRRGTILGFAHAVVAAVALFPFFGMVQEQLQLPGHGQFGFFGSGIDAPAPLLLLFGHLVFGASMGLFYGPVRADRARARYFEPGESGLPGEAGVVLERDDPVDSAFA